MTQYIDKAALVEEIERRKNVHFTDYHINRNGSPADYGACNALCQILSFINTLEAKEVDPEHLEREVEDFCYKFDDRKDKWYDMTPHDKNIMTNPTWRNFAIQLAKYFFELGLNARKGE